MNITLSKIEKRLQSLIEDFLTPHYLTSSPTLNFSRQLAEVIHSFAQENEAGNWSLLITFILPPAIATQWQADDLLLQKITKVIRIVCEEEGFSAGGEPAISISSDSELLPDEIRILASQRVQTIAETQNIAFQTEVAPELPENAFLIINGAKVVSLHETVINLGRRNDNHIVIDDPRISRYHAQLRVIQDRYVVFDLNSTGGTFVNGERITQSALYAGDVISLSGLPIIFGQDTPPQNPYLSDTMPLPQSTGEHPTVTLDKNASDLDKE